MSMVWMGNLCFRVEGSTNWYLDVDSEHPEDVRVMSTANNVLMSRVDLIKLATFKNSPPATAITGKLCIFLGHNKRGKPSTAWLALSGDQLDETKGGVPLLNKIAKVLIS